MKRIRRCEFGENVQSDKESSSKRVEIDLWLLVLPGLPSLASELILAEAGLCPAIGVCTVWRRVLLHKLNFRLAQTLESWLRGTADEELPWFSKTCALVHRLLSNGAISLDLVRAELAGRLIKKSHYFAHTYLAPPELREPVGSSWTWSFYLADHELGPSDVHITELNRLRVALESGMSPSALHVVLMRLPARTTEDPDDHEGKKIERHRLILGQLVADLFLHEYPVDLLRSIVDRLRNGRNAMSYCAMGTGYVYPVAVPSVAYVRAVEAALPQLMRKSALLLDALEAAHRHRRWGQPHQDLLKEDVIAIPVDVPSILRRTGKLAFKHLAFEDMLRHSWCSVRSFDSARVKARAGHLDLRKEELLYINANFEGAMSHPWCMAALFVDFSDPVSVARTVIGDDPTGLRAEFARVRMAQKWSFEPKRVVRVFEVLELAGYGKPLRQPKGERGAIALPDYYTELAIKAGMSS